MKYRYWLALLLLQMGSTMAASDRSTEAVAPTTDVWSDTGPTLGGFADLSFKNDYVTPRGLVITDRGQTIQFVSGLTMQFANGLTVLGGTAVDFNPNHQAPNTSDFNEFDYFVGISGPVAERLRLGIQYSQFTSGQDAYEAAKNVEFSAAYVDGAATATFHINPYAKLFWNVDGVSTAGLGRAGDTYDVEIGAAPAVVLNSITLIVPTWLTVGTKSYFGPKDDGYLGIFSTGLKIVKALNLGPKAGKWSVYATAQYYLLANDNILAAKAAFNQGDDGRNHLQYGVGVSTGF